MNLINRLQKHVLIFYIDHFRTLIFKCGEVNCNKISAYWNAALSFVSLYGIKQGGYSLW
ncbi:MAG: hypothetical protein BWY65_00037 [Firmicutes bacterium ADurb.Bin373]|nr:MAG: hypothetical protein BWY65_00037 [Firmicutes bacterium ADurb.Bin373]